MKISRYFSLVILCISLTAFSGPDFDDINDAIEYYSPKLIKLAIYGGVVYGGYRLYYYVKNRTQNTEDDSYKKGILWLSQKENQEKLEKLWKSSLKESFIPDPSKDLK